MSAPGPTPDAPIGASSETPAGVRVTGEHAGRTTGETAAYRTPAHGTPTQGMSVTATMRARGTGLRLYALVGHEPSAHTERAPAVVGTSLVSFRDVAAVVAPAPYSAEPVPLAELDAYRAVVDGFFARGSVVPAPLGTVFRSRDALLGWLELHYFTLAEALSFVEDRVAARVTVTRVDEASGAVIRDASGRALQLAVDESPEGAEASDLVALAADGFRTLRRDAVSLLVLRPAGDGGAPADEAAHGSFLVERARWTEFVQAVAREAERHPALHFQLTGPWPPYDFVRLEFHG